MPLRTQLQILYHYPNTQLGLIDAFRLLFSRTHYILDPKHRRKLSLPLPIEPHSIYTFPWTVIHGCVYSTYISLHYFCVDYPLTLTYYKSRSALLTESLPSLYPKLWASCPLTIVRGFHYPTVPQHNHRDSS